MAQVAFHNPPKDTDMVFYDSMKQKTISLISPLTCNNGHEAFADIFISGDGNRFAFDILGACCHDFLARAKAAMHPLAE
jgi:hypothetical protein